MVGFTDEGLEEHEQARDQAEKERLDPLMRYVGHIEAIHRETAALCAVQGHITATQAVHLRERYRRRFPEIVALYQQLKQEAEHV